MPQFNYHHLYYFWVVAREGGITPASRVLGVTQPTISAQISALEASLGGRLFRRRGNRLEITDLGRVVQQHAADIFALGETLSRSVEGYGETRRERLAVGIDDALPLRSAHLLLAPALALSPQGFRLILRTEKPDRLLAALSARTLDVVLTDLAVGPSSPQRAFTHLLAESGLTLFAAPSLAARLGTDFPSCLEGAPFIFHTESTPMRRGLDDWLSRQGIYPQVAGEVENVALLQLLGREGRGVFAAPTLVEDEICVDYGVQILGRIPEVVERFYAVTLEREPSNEGVRALLRTRGAP